MSKKEPEACQACLTYGYETSYMIITINIKKTLRRRLEKVPSYHGAQRHTQANVVIYMIFE